MPPRPNYLAIYSTTLKSMQFLCTIYDEYCIYPRVFPFHREAPWYIPVIKSLTKFGVIYINTLWQKLTNAIIHITSFCVCVSFTVLLHSTWIYNFVSIITVGFRVFSVCFKHLPSTYHAHTNPGCTCTAGNVGCHNFLAANRHVSLTNEISRRIW